MRLQGPCEGTGDGRGFLIMKEKEKLDEICAKIPKDLGASSEPGPFLKGLLAAKVRA
jgi:hypothetical protein